MNTSPIPRRPRPLALRERRRIGRALHEDVAQDLVAANFLLASLAPHVKSRRDATAADLACVTAILERNICSLCQLAQAIAEDSVEVLRHPAFRERD